MTISSRQPPPLTAFLMRRILLCLLPLIILSLWLVFESTHSLRVQQTREAQHLAKSLMAEVDLFLDARIRGLQILAESSLVDDPAQWPHLHRQAQGFFSGFDSHVTLLELDDSVSVRLHSRLPYGSPMPQPPRAVVQTARQTIASGTPVVSDVFIGALTGDTTIIIAVPVTTHDPPSLVFIARIPTEHYGRYLNNDLLPKGWSLHLHDNQGQVISCSSPEPCTSKADSSTSRSFLISSGVSGWSVVLQISHRAWHAPLLSSAAILMIGTLLSAFIGLFIGHRTSHQLGGQITALMQIEKPEYPLGIVEFQSARLLLDDTLTAMRQQMEETNKSRLEAEKALTALEQHHAALEQLNYTISHDLRTPLVTIETFLGFLEQDIIAGDQHLVANDMEHVRTAARCMNSLLNDLGRLLQTKNNEQTTMTTFERLTDELTQLVAGPCKIRGTELIIVPCDLDLRASQSHLIQIWQNLIENAVKYMGQQTRPVIEIGVSKQADDPIFYVRDNGMGIDPRDQQRIFGLFDQVDPNNPGSGLGLTLVKRIVEFYSGRIWVESAGMGQGSCFYFTLPGAMEKGRFQTEPT